MLLPHFLTFTGVAITGLTFEQMIQNDTSAIGKQSSPKPVSSDNPAGVSFDRDSTSNRIIIYACASPGNRQLVGECRGDAVFAE
jgi:hypothetical protein